MSRFAKGLLLYCLIFLLLAAAALGVLAVYLREYEATRSTSCVRAYLSDCAAGKLSYSWGAALAGLDRRFQSEEEIRAWLGEKLETAVTRELRCDEPGEKLYGVFSEDGLCLAKLNLRQKEKGRWGLAGWEIVGEECGVENFTQTLDITVPNEYTVELGGQALDARYVTDGKVFYTLLEPFRSQLSDAPLKSRYQLGPYLPGPELRVLNAEGKPVSGEELDEYRTLQNCSGKETERLLSFARSYLDAFLPYAGDLNRYGLAYWNQLYPLIVPGGELENRLIQTREGFGFGNTYSIEVLSDEVLLSCDLGGGRYVLDLAYSTETVGLHGPVQEDNRMRLLIVETDGQLYAASMYSY